MGNLQGQAINSIKWTTIQTIFMGLSAPVLLIIQARFLSPAEFGVLAIVTIFIGLFNTLENFGISQAVIQRDEVSTEEISSLFFFNIILVSFLGFTLFVLSSSIASLFSIEELSFLLKITSLMVLINGPSLLFRALLEKYMYFKELSIINIIRNIALIVTIITLLYLGFGVLGVVLGQVFSLALSVILVIIVSIRRKVTKLSLYFSFSKVYSFLKFGIYVSGKQIMTFLTHHIDELIIGYFLSNEILGVYHFAKNMLERLRMLITSSFSKVLFPILSKLKNNNEKLTIAYNKISQYLAFFTFPVFIGIALTAHLFVPLIFGFEWIDSIPFFQIFSLILIPLVLTANLSSSLLYSVGRPDVVFNIDVVTNSIYIVTLGLLANQGVYSVLFIYGAYVLYKTVTLQYQTNKHLLDSFLKYILSFWRVMLVSISMAVSVILIQNFLSEMMTLFGQFIISILAGILVYSIGAFLFERKILIELKLIVTKGRVDLVSNDLKNNNK